MSYYMNDNLADSLYHYGILGMKWGQRNGPPYPLDQKDKSAAEKVAINRKKTERKALRDKVKQEKAIERGKKHNIAGSIAGGVLKNLLVSELAKQSAVVLGMATMDPIMSTIGAYSLAAPLIAVNTIHTGKNIVDRMIYLKSLKD